MGKPETGITTIIAKQVKQNRIENTIVSETKSIFEALKKAKSKIKKEWKQNITIHITKATWPKTILIFDGEKGPPFLEKIRLSISGL